jgi:hypothetical protein
MRVTYTYTVFWWTGSYNKQGETFPTLAQASAVLGHNRNGYIGKNRIVEEV